MFCPACGNEIPEDARNCEHCGANTEPEINFTASDTSSSDQQGPPPGTNVPQPATPPPSGGRYSPRDIEFKPIEWMQEAWQIIQKDLTNFLVFQLVFSVIAGILSATVIGVLALPGIYAGYNLVLMRYLRQQSTLDIGKMLQEGWPFYVNMLVLMLIGGLLSAVASICLILPGIMLMIAFWIAAFLIVDKNAEFGQAMSAAFAVISKYFGGLLVFALVYFVIAILIYVVMLIPILGWIVSIAVSLIIVPITGITCYKAYEKLF